MLPLEGSSSVRSTRRSASCEFTAKQVWSDRGLTTSILPLMANIHLVGARLTVMTVASSPAKSVGQYPLPLPPVHSICLALLFSTIQGEEAPWLTKSPGRAPLVAAAAAIGAEAFLLLVPLLLWFSFYIIRLTVNVSVVTMVTMTRVARCCPPGP